MHKAQVFTHHGGGWGYRLQAGNGEIIGQSEGYIYRWSAVRAAKKNTDATRIEVFNSQGGIHRVIER